ncbi:MAG: DUF4956 domain-containing protein [Saprospiraceae bacterium]
MNSLSRFEQYLNQFTDTTNVAEFLINMLIATVLAALLQFFYIRFGNSITNRKRFANIFLPLALATMLIITIVKSSIALSLGLVGALSIVRFRAAIKDPEELTYLFLVIGVGLGTGAGQTRITSLATLLILLLLFVNQRIRGEARFKSDDKLYVNISTNITEITPINDILKSTFTYVELKRFDTLESGLEISYICKANDVAQIDAARKALLELSPATTISVIDQPDLIV